MSTTTVPLTVSAPSAATREQFGFFVRLKNAANTRVKGTRDWVREGSRRIGIDRAGSFAKRYLRKAYGVVATIVRAAGFIPLSLLAVTSRSGQAAIKQVVGFASGVISWTAHKIWRSTLWIFRKFGKPGNAMADWSETRWAKTKAWATQAYINVATAVGPYLSPERLYMRVTKVGAYMAVAAGLISTFVSGAFLIPAYLFAGVAGLIASPTVRNSVVGRRILGTYQDTVVEKGKESVTQHMSEMVAEYGPDMEKWSQAARHDYEVKQAILDSLNNEPDPFKKLSNNQKKKAEKWLREFEESMANNLLAAEAATGEKDIVVTPDGKVAPVEPVEPAAS